MYEKYQKVFDIFVRKVKKILIIRFQLESFCLSCSRDVELLRIVNCSIASVNKRASVKINFMCVIYFTWDFWCFCILDGVESGVINLHCLLNGTGRKDRYAEGTGVSENSGKNKNIMKFIGIEFCFCFVIFVIELFWMILGYCNFSPHPPSLPIKLLNY